MLEALSGAMLSGRIEVGGFRLIRDEKAIGSLETGVVLRVVSLGVVLLEVAVVAVFEMLKLCIPTVGALTP